MLSVRNNDPAGLKPNAPDWTDEAISALLQEASFDHAMSAAAKAIVGHYRGRWVLNRLVNDRGRFLLSMMVLDLHHTNRGLGFSRSQMQFLAASTDVCSPGRVAAFLASLRLLGLLRSMPSEDQRLRRLVPTRRLLEMHQERWQGVFKALALVRSEGVVAVTAARDPAFLGAFAHALMNVFRAGLRLSDVVPEIRNLAERDAGLMILIAVFLADAERRLISTTALARSFTVSRAHVLAVLREAEATGLVQVSGQRGGYYAGPNLAPTLRRFFAVVFLLHVHGIHAASAEYAHLGH